MIYLLSGPIRSGKTSALAAFIQTRACAGIWAPDNDEGLRILVDLSTQEKIIFQKNESTNESDVLIGKYIFDNNAFTIANNILKAAANTEADYIIIDEVGKLEMMNQGIHLGLMVVLAAASLHKDIVLVVRDTLLDIVIEKYALVTFKVIDKEELMQLP
jgi:nucleoside-triphosphatase